LRDRDPHLLASRLLALSLCPCKAFNMSCRMVLQTRGQQEQLEVYEVFDTGLTQRDQAAPIALAPAPVHFLQVTLSRLCGYSTS
jgi:hypothetical protein